MFFRNALRSTTISENPGKPVKNDNPLEIFPRGLLITGLYVRSACELQRPSPTLGGSHGANAALLRAPRSWPALLCAGSRCHCTRNCTVRRACLAHQRDSMLSSRLHMQHSGCWTQSTPGSRRSSLNSQRAHRTAARAGQRRQCSRPVHHRTWQAVQCGSMGAAAAPPARSLGTAYITPMGTRGMMQDQYQGRSHH